VVAIVRRGADAVQAFGKRRRIGQRVPRSTH